MPHYLSRYKCAAISCNKLHEEVKYPKLFRFPRGKPGNSRYRLWAEVAKNPKINLEKISKAFLCGRHFARNQFRDADCTMLIYGAVPTTCPISPDRNLSLLPADYISADSPSKAVNSVDGNTQCDVTRAGALDLHASSSPPPSPYRLPPSPSPTPSPSPPTLVTSLPTIKETTLCPPAETSLLHPRTSRLPSSSAPSPTVALCLPSFTLHAKVVKLAPDLAVLGSMKEELLRTQLNIIIDRVAELRLKCTEEQQAASRIASSPHDLQLEVQRLERLSVYLDMLLAFLNKWKMKEIEEMKWQAEIKRRMNLFDKLLKVVVNKEPKEPNNS